MKEMNDVQELMDFIKQVTNEELTKRKKGDSPLHVKIELHEADDGTRSVELKINDGGAIMDKFKCDDCEDEFFEADMISMGGSKIYCKDCFDVGFWKGADNGHCGMGVRSTEWSQGNEPTKEGNKTFFTKHSLFMNQAPSFNFDLDEDALLKKALESGFVTKVDDDKYLMNDQYGEE